MKQDSLLITGAASGLGRGFALRSARPGVTLHLIDSNEIRLKDTASRAEGLGARVSTHALDVTDAPAMRQAVEAIGVSGGSLDVVLACAGITGGVHERPGQDGAPCESEYQVRRMMDVNVNGVLNTVFPALDVIRRQPVASDGFRGRIAAISSIAGLVSFPGTPSYCAAKAAVDRLMVATGGNLKQDGILLSSVVCGFINTPMVATNEFAMPGLVQTAEAVERIMAGLEKNRRRITFPRWIAAGSRLMDLLPIGLAERYYQNQPTGAAGSMPVVRKPSDA
ncbi:SDR family NAD(P)-dependent oxidoreductase [Acetobacter sp.]|jgi:NAD(P)-dependent dehydrogenase (short-subunit alcohol dehydrogenase family)|uniref:SDR family NAD(P)-dependent oxidoreductase n=1 Tax=Acetobacter sp. TaxID=440 RepID=UPI0025C3F95B|nr:SDR family NAD(P)-dependent oxidoreductase [Acetobacter sp.]MCH4091567.1 SDR family NAD(P)-dependent oxidoreductase [Acetobacter sp.]